MIMRLWFDLKGNSKESTDRTRRRRVCLRRYDRNASAGRGRVAPARRRLRWSKVHRITHQKTSGLYLELQDTRVFLSLPSRMSQILYTIMVTDFDWVSHHFQQEGENFLERHHSYCQVNLQNRSRSTQLCKSKTNMRHNILGNSNICPTCYRLWDIQA